MTIDPQTTDRIRALALLEAADLLRDAHFREGLSVQEIGTALRQRVGVVDPRVGRLALDGFGSDEIAVTLAAAPVPAVRPELRDQIAATVEDFFEAWRTGLGDVRPQDALTEALADVLPATTNRAVEERLARIREWVTSDVVTAVSGFGDGYREAQRDIRDLLAPSRLAVEAQQQTETPCGPAPDRCDAEAGEPCSSHEREQAHAEGEHCFCGSECDKACTCGSAGDAFVPIGHYADCPQYQPAVVAAVAGEEPELVADPQPVSAEFVQQLATVKVREDATVDPAMCPHCKGDNREAFALCPACAEADGRLLCPYCRTDITDYAEDDHVWRTGDERPYCSSDCVIAAHRKNLPTTPAVPVQHAPGIAILCADCRAKGHAVCMDAAMSQPNEGPRTVCVCGHTRGEHITVSGRLLCDECDPDSTDNLTCTGFEAL